MIRILLTLSFLFTSQNLMANTIERMSNQVNQLTKRYGDDLEQADRRAIRRRLQVILDIYEDAGFGGSQKAEFICSGRTLYTQDGKAVISTSDSQQCQFNLEMNRQGSEYLCAGRTVYTKQGRALISTSDRNQCHSNLEFSARGAGGFMCASRTLYNEGRALISCSDRKQCTTNMEAIVGGSDRVCAGRTLYNLEGKAILSLSSRKECEEQILL